MTTETEMIESNLAFEQFPESAPAELWRLSAIGDPKLQGRKGYSAH